MGHTIHCVLYTVLIPLAPDLIYLNKGKILCSCPKNCDLLFSIFYIFGSYFGLHPSGLSCATNLVDLMLGRDSMWNAVPELLYYLSGPD